MALDLQEVKAGEFAEPICELELELLAAIPCGTEAGKPAGFANRFYAVAV